MQRGSEEGTTRSDRLPRKGNYLTHASCLVLSGNGLRNNTIPICNYSYCMYIIVKIFIDIQILIHLC